MRKITRIVVCTMLLLLPCSRCYAYTAEDLYNDLGIEYKDPYSNEDLNTIARYRYAKKYTRIFGNLSAMEFPDYSERRGEELEKQKTEIEDALSNGFNLKESDIYNLEQNYKEIVEEIEKNNAIAPEKEIEVAQLDIEGIPSYNQYATANARYSLITTWLELGGNTPMLTPGAYVISDSSPTSITIGTTEQAVITSLFNGTVIDVDDDIVTIDHHTRIYSSYKGIHPSVKEGDQVGQGMCIGYSKGNVGVKMSVGGNLINIKEYLEGD